MSYNYIAAMKQDIWEYIRYEVNIEEYSDPEKLAEDLEEQLWVTDSVTGNASGSYTFSRLKAKKYVMGNIDLFNEAVEVFCIDYEQVGKKFLEEDFEWMDVTIRCSLLNQAIAEVIDDFGLCQEE